MRMVKFHHRASTGAAPSPAAQLAAIMGSTEYILHADQLGADASTVSSWGPFSGVGSPVVDADGYLGSLKAVNLNGTSQALLHPSTNLVTPSTPYTFVMAFQLPAGAGTRVLYGFSSSGTERHGIWLYVDEGTYVMSGTANPFLTTYQPEETPIIMVANMRLGGVAGAVKFYSSAGNVLRSMPATMPIGTSVLHTIGCYPDAHGAWLRAKVRFAALSINPGTLHEAGMDALASFLQSGPYNCPLS